MSSETLAVYELSPVQKRRNPSKQRNSFPSLKFPFYEIYLVYSLIYCVQNNELREVNGLHL